MILLKKFARRWILTACTDPKGVVPMTQGRHAKSNRLGFGRARRANSAVRFVALKTLTRDLHCANGSRSYFLIMKADRVAPPSPDTPVARPDKPELRQQLKSPKRLFAWGSFFDHAIT
jgi:hypothetical protein